MRGCRRMEKLKRVLGIVIATAYFIFPMSFILILLIFTPLTFFSDVRVIRNSGFAGPDYALAMIGFSGLAISMSLLIPALRRIYSFFPWLYAFIEIFFINFIIITFGISILNFGYKTIDPTRHTLFYVIMIIFVVVGRIGMSVYYKWKPVNTRKEGMNQ